MQVRHNGFFSEAEKEQMKRDAAHKVIKPYKDNIPVIAIGVAILCAYAARDYGLIGCVIAGGIGAGLSYALAPSVLNKMEDAIASSAQVEEKVVYYRAG